MSEKRVILAFLVALIIFMVSAAGSYITYPALAHPETREHPAHFDNGSVVRFYITYPATVKPGETFILGARALHLEGTPDAIGVTLTIYGEPSRCIGPTLGTNQVFLGTLSADIPENTGEIELKVAEDCPPSQTLTLRIVVGAYGSAKQVFAPDIVIHVEREGFWGILARLFESPWGLGGIISVVGVGAIATIWMYTRRKPRIPPPPPILPTPPKPGPKPPKPGPVHRPQVVEVRRKKEG